MDNNQVNPHQVQGPSYEKLVEDEIDFVELFSILKKSRLVVFSISLACFTLAAIYSFRTDDVFRAESVLIPVGNSGAGASLGGQLGQAASFVGINIGEENRQLDLALAALRSREVIGQFIRENNLAVPLVAGRWNRQVRISEVDSELYDTESSSWQGDFAPDGPTDWQLYNAFSSILTVTEDRQSSIIRVSIEWHDPVLAAAWVNGLVEKVNSLVKAKDLAEANRAIEFSQSQLQSTQLVEMQRIFYDIIEEQTKVVMLADVRDEYVFQVVDRAVVAEEKIAPRRILILIGGTFIGVFLGVLFSLFKHYIQITASRSAK